MLIFLFKPLKWFLRKDTANKALVLSIISFIVYGIFFLLSWLDNIAPTSLFGKLVRESFGFILAVSAIYDFVVLVKNVWDDRKDCWNEYGFYWQYQNILCGIFGVVGFWSLVNVVGTILEIFWGISLPAVPFLYALIPGGFFLAVAVFTFVAKVLKKVWASISRYVKDQWDKA